MDIQSAIEVKKNWLKHSENCMKRLENVEKTKIHNVELLDLKDINRKLNIVRRHSSSDIERVRQNLVQKLAWNAQSFNDLLKKHEEQKKISFHNYKSRPYSATDKKTRRPPSGKKRPKSAIINSNEKNKLIGVKGESQELVERPIEGANICHVATGYVAAPFTTEELSKKEVNSILRRISQGQQLTDIEMERLSNAYVNTIAPPPTSPTNNFSDCVKIESHSGTNQQDECCECFIPPKSVASQMPIEFSLPTIEYDSDDCISIGDNDNASAKLLEEAFKAAKEQRRKDFALSVNNNTRQDILNSDIGENKNTDKLKKVHFGESTFLDKKRRVKSASVIQKSTVQPDINLRPKSALTKVSKIGIDYTGSDVDLMEKKFKKDSNEIETMVSFISKPKEPQKVKTTVKTFQLDKNYDGQLMTNAETIVYDEARLKSNDNDVRNKTKKTFKGRRSFSADRIRLAKPITINPKLNIDCNCCQKSKTLAASNKTIPVNLSQIEAKRASEAARKIRRQEPEKKERIKYEAPKPKTKKINDYPENYSTDEIIDIWTRKFDIEIETEAQLECQQLHDKLVDNGVAIDIETIQRGLFPPTEYAQKTVLTDSVISKKQSKPFDTITPLLSHPRSWLSEEYKKLDELNLKLKNANRETNRKKLKYKKN